MIYIRVLVLIALAFLSATALYGGAVLMAEAHGNPWGMMPLSLLAHSPFRSWLIPGIVLAVANGVCGLWVLGCVAAHLRHDGLWTLLQGCILLGWLTVECVMLRTVIWPHYLYGAVAVALIVSGAVLRHEPRMLQKH
jgi:hypothetical protein